MPDAEPELDIGDQPDWEKFSFPLKAVDQYPDELSSAIAIYNSAITAVYNLHALYEAAHKSDIENPELPATFKDDVIRSILLFISSGLDAVIKQIVRDCIKGVVYTDEGAHQQFQKFIERRLRRNSDDAEQSSREAGSLDAKLLSTILSSPDPRSVLITNLVTHLTSDSLQSVDQILKVGAHFALTREELIKDFAACKAAFHARNQIAHEMDIDLAAENGRRPRDHLTVMNWSESINSVSSCFIEGTRRKLLGEPLPPDPDQS